MIQRQPEPIHKLLGRTIDYYESVTAKMGRKDAESFTRLYMVPGMQHCVGGPGPNNFGNAMRAALQHWVEQGSASDKILATKYKSDANPSSGVARTRPLCPYPQVARYQGSGSITTPRISHAGCLDPVE